MAEKKRFSRALFTQYDQAGRTAAKKWLASLPGVEDVKDNPERYGADILYQVNGQQHYLEAEVKAVWEGGSFPYPDIQVLERKKKYFVAGVDMFLVSGDGSQYAFIKAEDILQSPQKVVYTKYTAKESFFVVPVTKAVFGKVPE